MVAWLSILRVKAVQAPLASYSSTVSANISFGGDPHLLMGKGEAGAARPRAARVFRGEASPPERLLGVGVGSPQPVPEGGSV